MRNVFLLFFLFAMISVRAQVITGTVLSASDSKPVEFANILLLQLPDSVFLSGVITYEDGNYTIENVKPGKYYIKCSFVGFDDNGISIEIKEGVESYVADTIFLSENTNELSAVDVVGDKIRGQELVDRTVYTIPPEIAKSSANGYEILRKIPSVQVDFNNNVTLEGKSNFIIQVDGKQRDKEFLARLLPEDIESIEIITNPSGKYDASIDGVINIKLTKAARVGINGNISGMIRPAEKPSGYGAGGLDYGLEKITFYISGYSFFQGLDNTTTNYNRFTTADSIQNNVGKGDFKINASAINVGFDYRINDKNTLSLNTSYKPNRIKNKLENHGTIYNNDIITNYQDYLSNTYTESDEKNVSLFYKKEFKKPIQELTIESTYYLFNSKDDNDFSSELHNVQTNEIDSTERIENVVNERSYWSAKIDYVQPIGMSMRFETGYQVYYQALNYDFKTSDVGLSNVFDYNELRNGAYVGWTWNIKKFGFQATLRAEYSDIQVSDDYSSDYFTFLPSSNIQYKISANSNIKFTYNRRINRPDIYGLNPFPRLSNSLTVSTGNPYLEPELRDKLQLTYSINFGKNYFTPHIYYEHISKKISTINEFAESPLTGSETIISTPQNILSGYETGVGLNAMLWFFNVNASFYKGSFNEFTNQFTTIEARDYYSFRLNSFAFKQFFKQKFTAFAFINYNGVRVDAQSKTYNDPVYGFGGQYTGKSHSFGVFYIFPFRNSEFTYSRSIIETPYVYSKSTNGFDVNTFIQIQYTYKFNKGRNIKKIKRESEIESDTKGGGIGR